jgi:hypothetical protein
MKPLIPPEADRLYNLFWKLRRENGRLNVTECNDLLKKIRELQKQLPMKLRKVI